MKPLMYNGRKINKTATMFSTDVGNVLVNQMNGIKHSDLLNNLADRIDEKKLNLPNGVKYNFQNYSKQLLRRIKSTIIILNHNSQ